MSIAERISAIRVTLPEGVTLVAVSKFHPADVIAQAYAAGQRVFGESRVRELLDKRAALPDDIHWHFIGHLQTNKAKALVGNAELIESIDSQRLLDLVDSIAAARGICQRVLLQVHVAAEETKTGFAPDELLEYFDARRFESLRATRLCGIMGMATNTDDMARVRADFEAIAALHRRILELCPDLQGFDTVSMGMSGDYPTAIEAGSTMVRVGTAIFGEREY